MPHIGLEGLGAPIGFELLQGFGAIHASIIMLGIEGGGNCRVHSWSAKPDAGERQSLKNGQGRVTAVVEDAEDVLCMGFSLLSSLNKLGRERELIDRTQ